MLRISARILNTVERNTSGEVGGDAALKQAAGSAIGPVLGNRVGKLISAVFSALVRPTSPCMPPTTNCSTSTPLARNPKRHGDPETKLAVVGIVLALPETQPMSLHPSCLAILGLKSEEPPSAPFSIAGSVYSSKSCVGTASISPKPR